MINWWIKIQTGLWIYKRKQESKETRKHASNQESDQEKKERKHALDQESKIQEETITIEKK